jgi:hypothetical protein
MPYFSYDMIGRNGLVRGDRFKRTFRWLTAGVPVDMTGWSGVLKLQRPGNDLPLVTSPLVLGPDGTIVVNVLEATTQTLPKGELVYLTTLTDASGIVQTRMVGRLEVL